MAGNNIFPEGALDEAASLVEKHGSIKGAARESGIPRTTLRRRLRASQERDEIDPAIQSSMSAIGTGMVPSMAWIKTKGDAETPGHSVLLKPDTGAQHEQSVISALEAAADMPRLEPIAPPEEPKSSALLNLVTLADAHIGALAWHRESGDDWDLEIAEERLTNAFRSMIAKAPAAETIFLSVLGDWMDRDMQEPITTLSGNVLDTDGRQDKMMDVALRVLRKIVDEALATHPSVKLLVAEGNHDLIGSRWITKLFGMLYENEPRLGMIDAPLPYYRYLHGETFIGFHHGHLSSIKKPEDLVLLMADEFRKDWGESSRCYIHSGHFHHNVEIEVRGGKLLQHPTLATRSAWAARHGYDAMREAMCITYHSRHGQTGRTYVTPEMLDEETA